MSVPYSLYSKEAGAADFNSLDNAPDMSIYATKDMNAEKITNMADP
ncbi:MAG: hypothetical protein K9J25_13175 [Bacteroidales bacterium]|nr:hypothetical protein [Bacteroidales bacterium]